MTQEISIPLCFESFQFLKQMWYRKSKENDEQLVEICEVPFEPMSNKLQQSCQVFHDPITDGLDSECNQNFSSLTNNQIQDQDDKGFISQTFQLE